MNKPGASLSITKRLSMLSALFLALGFPAGARAGMIYVAGSDRLLGTLDPTTGAITTIGITEIGSTSVTMEGLGFGPGGKLYGLGADDNLYAVNPTTAALTLIGPSGVNFSAGASMGNASDGTLYAQGTGVLSTVNPNTGALTTVGNLGFFTGADINGDASGNLYIINNTDRSLYSVSRTTGAGTLIGGPSTAYSDTYGMAFTNGTMYGMQSSGTGIYALNLTNGNATLVSNYSHANFGDIYAAAAPFQSVRANVPEPSSLALLGTGALALIGLGVARLRNLKCENRSK